MPSGFTFLETKVISIKYGRGTNNDQQIDQVMRDAYFKKYVQSSTCSLLFKDTINSGSSGQLFAYFNPPETGLYSFQVYCSYSCRLYIATPGKQDRRVLFNNGYIHFFIKYF